MDMIQNLEDAGCDEEAISKICDLYDAGKIQDTIKVLRRHRCDLMECLHESQSRVDCLDYLIYQLEKALKGKNV